MRKVGRSLDRVIAYLGYGGAAMGVISVLIMTVMITIGALLRYLVNVNLKFVDEYGGYLLVVVVFMGLAYTMRKEAHVAADIVVSKLPKRARNGVHLATSVIALVLICMYLWSAWQFFVKSLRSGMTSVT
ncbi:MAG: TRAP transporter small permease subunit, partial [Chloroflexi bacterium]|nr:TRAP transporter small permease subunit [Chloroflexota bacterium]